MGTPAQPDSKTTTNVAGNFFIDKIRLRVTNTNPLASNVNRTSRERYTGLHEESTDFGSHTRRKATQYSQAGSECTGHRLV